jgi:hypothetical protein
MTHSAVLFNQFVTVFGGCRENSGIIPDDLCMLSLDGNLGKISHCPDIAEETKPPTLPEV